MPYKYSHCTFDVWSKINQATKTMWVTVINASKR